MLKLPRKRKPESVSASPIVVFKKSREIPTNEKDRKRAKNEERSLIDSEMKQNDQTVNEALIAAFKLSKMKKSPPKVELSVQEKKQLSSAEPKISLNDVLEYTPEDLSKATGISVERCEEIVALVQFQLLGSVSKAIAVYLWRLGFKRLEQLGGANPVKMYNHFSEIVGKVDPCAEDVFRSAIAQVKAATMAKDFAQYKDWWIFKNQRGKPDVVFDDLSASTMESQKLFRPPAC